MKKVAFPLSLAVLLAAALQAPPSLAQNSSDWKPYIEAKKGDKEFPSDPKLMKDEDWAGINYTEFTGFKPRIGVMMMESHREGSQEYSNEWIRYLASRDTKSTTGGGLNDIESLVRQAMGKTNRFTMVERTTAVDDIVGEQDFGASGRVDKKTAPKIGKIKGADYSVKVELVDANPDKESKSIGAMGGGIGRSTAGLASLGLSGQVAWVRLNVRIIRTETSEIVGDITVDGTAKSKGMGIGGGLIKAAAGGVGGGGLGYSSKKTASLSDAAQVAANKAAYMVAMKLADLPWEGSVSKADGTKLYVNAGTNVGLKPGLVLTLFAKGEELKDPDTGESLGFERNEIGSATIKTVTEKFSICEITTGGKGVKIGDIVQLVMTK